MSRAEWLALAERCQKAKGPDHEIDATILRALGFVEFGTADDGGIHWAIPRSFSSFEGRPSASLDAIIELIEEELPGWYWSAIKRATPLGKHTAEGVISNGKLFATGEHRGWDVFAYTPALALCAAFCAAMAERAEA